MGILKGMQRILWFAFLWLMLSACTATTETAVPQPTTASETAALPTSTAPPPIITTNIPRVNPPTAVSDPTQPVDASPTAEPTPAEEAAVEQVGVISGRTEEGAFFLGDPNAPITHIDYSDFL